MKFPYVHIIRNLFVEVMAILVLNVSIDAIEFEPIAATVTLGDFNYINSMAEYIAEIVLGNKDAFPEYQKESTSTKSQFAKNLSLKLYHQDHFTYSPSYTFNNVCYIVPLKEEYNYLYFKEINPPPPKM